MDCLFDSDKDCMNEKSHHLTNVSAMQGDKQRRAEGKRERRDEGRKRRRSGREGGEGFFELWEAFQFYRTVPSRPWLKRSHHHSLSLSFSIFSNNAKPHSN